MALVNTSLRQDLKAYGFDAWDSCIHCGNCTATCQLTDQTQVFPRKSIRLAQMGLKNELKQNVEPWLCYYCGECSDKCPKDANPGEIMMSLRRYLTSLYDWTGLSGKLYKSFRAHLALVFILFGAVIAAFLVFAKFPEGDVVRINTFAPTHTIHVLDTILLATLGFFLITNILNMFWHIIIKDKNYRFNLFSFIKEAFVAFFHFITQWRFSKCKRKLLYWIGHWMLMSSYILMFILIIFFLDWFQVEEVHPVWHPQRLLGYYATAGFMFGTIYFMIGRRRKSNQIFKYSHHSDWIFVILLFLLAFTGILIHIFRLNNMPMATYWSYILHLAVEVPMVVTFVAFSKWSHLAYRPLAIWFANTKKRKATAAKDYKTLATA